MERYYFRGRPIHTIVPPPAIEGPYKPPYNPDKWVGWAVFIAAVFLCLLGAKQAVAADVCPVPDCTTSYAVGNQIVFGLPAAVASEWFQQSHPGAQFCGQVGPNVAHVAGAGFCNLGFDQDFSSQVVSTCATPGAATLSASAATAAPSTNIHRAVLAVGPLPIEATYRSDNVAVKGGFGPGWMLNDEGFLRWDPAEPGVARVYDPNGTTTFALNTADWTGSKGKETLSWHPAGYWVRTKDGIQHWYNFPWGEKIWEWDYNTVQKTIIRDGNTLLVKDEWGRELRFYKDDEGRIVQAITPEGWAIDFTYNGPSVESASYPATGATLYWGYGGKWGGFGPPYALTTTWLGNTLLNTTNYTEGGSPILDGNASGYAVQAPEAMLAFVVPLQLFGRAAPPVTGSASVIQPPRGSALPMPSGSRPEERELRPERPGPRLLNEAAPDYSELRSQRCRAAAQTCLDKYDYGVELDDAAEGVFDATCPSPELSENGFLCVYKYFVCIESGGRVEFPDGTVVEPTH